MALFIIQHATSRTVGRPGKRVTRKTVLFILRQTRVLPKQRATSKEQASDQQESRRAKGGPVPVCPVWDCGGNPKEGGRQPYDCLAPLRPQNSRRLLPLAPFLLTMAQIGPLESTIGDKQP